MAIAPVSPDLQPALTTRQRVELQTRPDACQSCNATINPLGFALERFDASFALGEITPDGLEPIPASVLNPPSGHSGHGLLGEYFVGTEGKVWMFGLGADTKFEPASLARMPRQTEAQKIDGNQDHTWNFLECVRTRGRPNADVEIGCRSVTVCHLGNIAYRLNRPLRWDPDREEFVHDEEANRLRSRVLREPWSI